MECAYYLFLVELLKNETSYIAYNSKHRLSKSIPTIIIIHVNIGVELAIQNVLSGKVTSTKCNY